jgi:uncharacterized repeat protein (TIGR01451 family)
VSDDPLPTHRWVGVAGFALLLGGVGVLVREPGLLVAAALPVAYAAYARAGDAPTPSLAVERELADDAPEPGDTVEVTVRVRNVGERTLTDLRLVDGVPPGLAATGPARLGTALRPGRTAAFSYDVVAHRGDHEWDPLTAVVRDPAGAVERRVAVACETRLRCVPRFDAAADLPLRGLTTQLSGRVATDVAGTGVEFYATREYRRGDPRNRIDWNRRARTGELSTLQFREERAATVCLLVDARDPAYVAAGPDQPTAVERSLDAAGAAFGVLLDNGDRVGVAGLGDGECYLAPSSGEAHRATVREMLATHPTFSPTPGDASRLPDVDERYLHARLPGDAQAVLFSPVADGYPVRLARRLDAYGHAVTVVSPDPTAADTPGRTLASIERRVRLSRLRAAGLRVVDWRDGLAAALALASDRRRWSP